MLSIIVLLASLSSLVIGLPEKDCLLDLTVLNPQPIVLSETYQFLYPNRPYATNTKVIAIKSGESVIIACPGGQVITGKTTIAAPSIFASCNEQTQLVHDDNILNTTEIKCSTDRLETVKATGLSCGTHSKKTIIGYEIGLHVQFVPMIIVCYNHDAQTADWANYYLTSSLRFGEKNITTQVYLQDKNYHNLNTKFETMYTLDYQREHINALLGAPALSHKYLDKEPLLLTPLANPMEFVYRNQINATAHYLNTVPRWVPSGKFDNWARTEYDLIQYANVHTVDLDILTGTFGISSIGHFKTNISTRIYLGNEPKHNISVVPVPQLLWKVAYEPLSRRAIALITLNNPFQAPNSIAIPCDDISHGISWITWINKDDPANGMSWACTYHELRKYVNYLPVIDVQGVLY